jgi:AsmA family protein
LSERRRSSPWLIGLALVAAMVIVTIAVWDWDWFKPLAERQASAALGRPITIGHLHVGLARHPLIEIDQLTIGNPPNWSPDSHFATIDRLRVRIDALALLHRQIRLPEIGIDRPQLDLRTDPAGKPNWNFAGGKPRDPAAPPAALPEIGALRISDGKVHFEDTRLKSNFDVAIDTQPARNGGEAQLVAQATGTYAGQPITGHFIGGSLLSLRDPNRPYPVDLTAANGPTKLTLKGTVQQPMALAGADLNLDLQGEDLAALYPLSAIPFPQTAPYHLTGMVDYAESRIRFRNFTGTMGSSDLSGTITEDPGPDRPLVTIDVSSRKIVLADLAGFIGSTPGRPGAPNETPAQKQQRAAEQQKPKLLPEARINLPRLRAADLKVAYKAARIESQSTPLDNIAFTATVENGRLTVKPVRFGIGQGQIVGNVALDGQQDPTHAVADIDFRHVDLKRLMASTHSFEGVGTIGGQASIDTTGNSLSEMLGRGNGNVKLFMTGGEISALLVDLAGIEVGSALVKLLKLPDRTQIRCMVADLPLEQGVLKISTFALDTKESNIVARGNVNLRDEQLDLQINTEPKRFSIGSLPAPIDITGPLKSPKILPDPAAIGARAGQAAVLGVLLTPLGALLPTIQLGLGKDSDCNKLIADAQTGGQPRSGSSSAASSPAASPQGAGTGSSKPAPTKPPRAKAQN